MELLWYRIAVGQVVEEHPRYQIRRVYEGLNPFYIEMPVDTEQQVAARGGNPLCQLTPIGTYLSEPFYVLVAFGEQQDSDGTNDITP